MKALIGIFIALVIGIGAFKIYDHWEKVKERRVLDERAARGADIDPDQLPGMPWQLVVKLHDAQRGDAATFAALGADTLRAQDLSLWWKRQNRVDTLLGKGFRRVSLSLGMYPSDVP